MRIGGSKGQKLPCIIVYYYRPLRPVLTNSLAIDGCYMFIVVLQVGETKHVAIKKRTR
jgi:hypothetical protein